MRSTGRGSRRRRSFGFRAVSVGGSWVDGRLAGDLAVKGAAPDGILADVAGGSWRLEFRVGDRTSDRVLGGSDGLLVTQTNAGGVERIGYGADGASQRFPDVLASRGSDLRLLAVDRGRLLVAVEAGARTRLLVVDSASDRAVPVPLGAGVAAGPAAVRDGIAWLPWSPAGAPACVHGIDLDTCRPAPRAAVQNDAPRARIASFVGEAGPVEAVVYGDPDSADTLVLALHGGPLAAWTVGFEPLLASLAEAGAAVVAVNPRGSTRYGRAYAMAIAGAWGGPDLDDVLGVAAQLKERRGPMLAPPVVLGVSYGGFLALLAAALEPDCFSQCVALSAFTSGPRLAAASDGPVRQLLVRLGGIEPFRDGRGVRDAYERAPELRVPLLVVHGERDDVVPVSEARALVQRVRASVSAAETTYVEVPRAGHDLTCSTFRQTAIDAVVRHIARHASAPATRPVLSMNAGRR